MGSYVMAEAAEVCALPQAEAEALAQTGAKRSSNLLTGAMARRVGIYLLGVLILAVGGELDTAFVLPGIYSGDNPAPSASADALHIRFPDGAVIEYEPETSALTVSGIKTASVTASDSVTATVPVVMVKASTRVTLDTPEVVCTNRLITGTLEVQKGGTMRGNIEHTGGELSSNGKVLHTHKHPGDSGGTTGSPL